MGGGGERDVGERSGRIWGIVKMEVSRKEDKRRKGGSQRSHVAASSVDGGYVLLRTLLLHVLCLYLIIIISMTGEWWHLWLVICAYSQGTVKTTPDSPDQQAVHC